MNLREHRVPGGFRFAATTAGIKASGRPDLALIEAPDGATGAAMFTRNRVAAAPVVLGRQYLRDTRGRVRAVVVNAGNANCATGPAGLAAATLTCETLAGALGVARAECIPSSTGIIGVPFPVGKLVAAIPGLLAGRTDTIEGAAAVAGAIMTTDTRPKMASFVCDTGAGPVTVFGIAKGAGMIHPDMATMLVYVMTDAVAPAGALRRVLRGAVRATFNCISIDGDTSTNDTALLLASGASGVTLEEHVLHDAVARVCDSLARQIVADGEGVTHTVTVRVEGTSSHPAAHRVARTVAGSLLVKTAWAGADPNWGRLLAAAGRSGVAIDPDGVDIWIAGHRVCAGGVAAGFDAQGVHDAMKAPDYDILIRVGTGPGRARVLTADLTAEYVHINADYST